MLTVVYRNHTVPSACLEAIWFDDDGRTMVRMAPDNHPPAEGNYACFVAILDFWRLSPAACQGSDVAHFSSAVEVAVVRDLRAGRAILVLDLSNEGPEFDRTLFDEIHSYLDRNAIPAERAVWLNQNRAIERSYKAAYKDTRPAAICFQYYDYYIKLMAHWFASPSWRGQIISDSSGYAHALLDPSRKRGFALCLNATPRPHRVWTVAALHHFRVLHRCLVSFSGLSYAKGSPLQLADVQAMLDRQQLGFLEKACADIVAMSPFSVDEFADTGNQLVDKIDISTYVSTFFSIVTETDFSDGSIDRITEKVVKAFCIGHPTFVIGNPGAVRFITDLGFQSFAPVLPSGYDDITDPSLRFLAVLSEILGQIVSIQEHPGRWLARVADVTRFNILYSAGGLLRSYKARYDRPLVAALEKLLGQSEITSAPV